MARGVHEVWVITVFFTKHATFAVLYTLYPKLCTDKVVYSGRGSARTEDSQGTLTHCHTSPSIPSIRRFYSQVVPWLARGVHQASMHSPCYKLFTQRCAQPRWRIYLLTAKTQIEHFSTLILDGSDPIPGGAVAGARGVRRLHVRGIHLFTHVCKEVKEPCTLNPEPCTLNSEGGAVAGTRGVRGVDARGLAPPQLQPVPL